MGAFLDSLEKVRQGEKSSFEQAYKDEEKLARN